MSLKSVPSAAVLALGVPALAAPPEPGTHHLSLPLPAAAGAGQPVESRVLADTPHVKSVVIFLREGAPLHEHSSPHPASIQALSGQGRVRLGQTLVPISPTQMVLLEPGVPHEVIPDEGTDLVLLVQHLKGQP